MPSAVCCAGVGHSPLTLSWIVIYATSLVVKPSLVVKCNPSYRQTNPLSSSNTTPLVVKPSFVVKCNPSRRQTLSRSCQIQPLLSSNPPSLSYMRPPWSSNQLSLLYSKATPLRFKLANPLSLRCMHPIVSSDFPSLVVKCNPSCQQTLFHCHICDPPGHQTSPLSLLYAT